METPGECICTRLEDGRVRVDRADPYIRISLDLLKQLLSPPAALTSDASTLTIGDTNPVTYKLGDVVGNYIEAVLVS